MWFKKKKSEFISKEFCDLNNAAVHNYKIGTQINMFQKQGYEFVSIIGQHWDDHSKCNRVNVLFRKI